MNRQIVPSMLLSVLIVCFFAVILFERDSPKRSRGNDRAAKGKEAGAEHVASGPRDTGATPVTPRPADSKPKEQQKPEPGQLKGTAEQAVSPAIHKTAGSSPAQAASRAAAQDKPAPGPQDVTQTPASKTPIPVPPPTPAPPPAKESAPRIPAANRSDGPPVRKPPTEPVAASGPQQAFTAVREGESLRDVAIRVYGSADELDSLWRANRDVLPHKDSPLTAGSVLRTPAKKPGD